MRRWTAGEVEEMAVAAVARLRALAVDGVAPTKPVYDAQRGSGAPSSAVLFRHGVKWQELLRRAGLSGALRGYNTPAAVAKRNGDRLAPGVPNAVEMEIRAAFERGIMCRRCGGSGRCLRFRRGWRCGSGRWRMGAG
jgi:hypothetical protein